MPVSPATASPTTARAATLTPTPAPTPTPGATEEPAVAAPPPGTDVAPVERDRTIDLLRGVAILFVAIGHWLVVVPSYADGRFDGVNALGTVPAMRQLTWIFQVMPLFFVVGGYANGISWRRARRRHVPFAEWLRTRLVRLLRPTVALVGVWVGAGALLRAGGVDAGLVHTIAWLVVVPLWFLAVYVLVVAAAPVLLWAHERWGVFVLLVLVALASVVDGLRIGVGADVVAYTNFLWVFLFAQQLGFFLLDGRLAARRWQPAALLAGGLASLWLLTHVGPYPMSLVGVPGERIANNAPPTVTLVALGVAQVGFALLLRPVMSRWLQRRRVWRAVVAVNAHAMTILLWHFTALVLVAVVVLPLGVVPDHPAGSSGWWVVRVAAVVTCSAPLALLVALFGRVERGALVTTPAPTSLTDRVARPAPGTLRVVAATALLAVTFLEVTLRGLSIVDAPAGLPVTALGLGAAGVACLGGITR